MAFIFSNVTGAFVFNDNLDTIDKVIFKSLNDYRSREQAINSLKARHKDAKEPGEKEKTGILAHFKSREFLSHFRSRNIEISREDIRNSVKEDLLIIQSIGATEDLNKAINILAKRLREWYGLHNPEFSRAVEDHEKFVMIILKKKKDELLKEIGVEKSKSMGADLGQDHLDAMMALASQINELQISRKRQEEYLENVMKKFCPNIMAVAGVLTGAKLIGEAGSLKRLSIYPSSTIQILGAEKALFRHLKTGARPPKYGIIYSHQVIQSQKPQNQGKAARALADKLSIAAKMDYFKGEFIGDRLRKELDEKFAGQNE